jgi:hypothetical protein
MAGDARPRLGKGIIVRVATHRFRNWCTLLALSFLPAFARRFLARASVVLVLRAFVGRMREAMRRRRTAADRRRSDEHSVLPSLFERHPDAYRAPRRPIGIRSVPLDAIVGTMRHPSQNTADFLPLRRLRGANWRARWQRIGRANDRLATLPPVDLVQVGDEYYVADGHNRVAAARGADAVEIDADVMQLLVPGVTRPEPMSFDSGSLYGADEIRKAAGGRLSRTLEHRAAEDLISRRDLAPDLERDDAADGEGRE